MDKFEEMIIPSEIDSRSQIKYYIREKHKCKKQKFVRGEGVASTCMELQFAGGGIFVIQEALAFIYIYIKSQREESYSNDFVMYERIRLKYFNCSVFKRHSLLIILLKSVFYLFAGHNRGAHFNRVHQK
jgi:hypothetical protein